MNFGVALEACKAGKKVQRAGWNGKGMWIGLVPADQWGLGSGQHYDAGMVGSSLHPWIGMKAADESFFPWNPNNLDLLAEDWQIHKDEGTAAEPITAEQAMAEIWGIICPDCGPTNYAFIVKDVADMNSALRPPSHS